MRNFALSILAFCLLVFYAGCSRTSSEKADNSASNDSGDLSPQSDSSRFPLLSEKISLAELEMLDGSITRIADRKGKIVVLNLWATWCGPCRDEMPHLVEMQEQYRDKGLEVLGLNVGEQGGEPEPLEDITSFAESIKVNYILARIPEDITYELGRISKAQVVPQTFLLDREGRLRGVFVGGGPRIIRSMKNSVAKLVNE